MPEIGVINDVELRAKSKYKIYESVDIKINLSALISEGIARTLEIKAELN